MGGDTVEESAAVTHFGGIEGYVEGTAAVLGPVAFLRNDDGGSSA